LEPGTGVLINPGVADFLAGVAPASVHSIFPVSELSTPVARAGTGVGVAFFTTATGVASTAAGVAGGVVARATARFFEGVAVAVGPEAMAAGLDVGVGLAAEATAVGDACGF
jgi:hypothetical protein